MIKDIVLLVPDSCRETVRNCNRISKDFTEDNIKNDYNDACFCSFCSMWKLFQVMNSAPLYEGVREFLNENEKFPDNSSYMQML